MMRFKMFFFVAIFIVLSCWCSNLRAQSGITGARGRRVTCASDDGRRHLCPVDTRGGVQMVNQRSGSPCVQGSTWGYNHRGIWVDRGCRADFVLGRFGPPVGPPMRPPMNMITCSSNNGGRNFCGADTRGGVRLMNQRSGSPCIQGRTWGYDRRGVWVDRGCRADFALGR
jgi:hypothetical protein